MIQEYWLVRLRTSRKYLAFILLQCILSLLIVVLGVINHEHLKNPTILSLEYFLSATMLADIILRYLSEPNFFSRRDNVFDVVVYVVMVGLLIAITAEDEDGFVQGLEADDIIALLVVLARYAIQFVRLLMLIRNSHTGIAAQRDIKDVDMDAEKHTDGDDHHEQRVKGQIIKRISDRREEEQGGSLVNIAQGQDEQFSPS